MTFLRSLPNVLTETLNAVGAPVDLPPVRSIACNIGMEHVWRLSTDMALPPGAAEVVWLAVYWPNNEARLWLDEPWRPRSDPDTPNEPIPSVVLPRDGVLVEAGRPAWRLNAPTTSSLVVVGPTEADPRWYVVLVDDRRLSLWSAT